MREQKLGTEKLSSCDAINAELECVTPKTRQQQVQVGFRFDQNGSSEEETNMLNDEVETDSKLESAVNKNLDSMSLAISNNKA